jgi:CheY-like chemotaxis protein
LKDKQEHISVEYTNGKINLPLYNFFIALRQNNFLVTPKQIIDSNSIIEEYSERVQNEMELCQYLSPIFANSHEEQIQFKELFEQYFAPGTKKPEADFLHNKQKIPDHFKEHWWKYILALAFIVAALLYFLRKPVLQPRPAITITVNVTDSVATGTGKQTGNNLNRLVKAQLNINNQLAGTVPGIKLKTIYSWGDNTANDTVATHTYTNEGNYKITAYVEIIYKNYSQYTDTVFTDVAICFNTNQFGIEKSFKTDSVKIGDAVKLTAVINGTPPDSIIWASINDNKITPGNFNKSINIVFNKEGTETFYFTAVYDSMNAPCNGKAAITFFVYDENPKPYIQFSVPPVAKPLLPKYKVQQYWFYLLLLLAGLFLALTVYFARRWARYKKNEAGHNPRVKKDYEQLLQSFSGKAGAVDLPFLNKNYLPLPEPALADVARQMRKRISDDAQYLHLQKTIARAIVNAGFFQPVQEARTRQSEYLILIDEHNSNNQQVKLFEYLLELLQKQNVFIEKFYFKEQPKWCCNLTHPQGISLEKLSEKFPKHVLLIFGNGYQLIYQDYPVIDNSYLQYLRRWQYKAVVTPVSFLDWGNKEKKALLDELPVLPVDIPGQLLLLQKLFGEEINVLADLKIYAKSFYETELIDFEDVDELYEYCENAAWARVTNGGKYDNVLFQWIAALAVYPKITWQLTLALGKAIMDSYGKLPELNFTTLLRIARIKWMKDGKFPDYTRLNLLKHLSKKNEVIARENILLLLNEIPHTELSIEHFAYEEKETQRLINEFNLYAFDPVKYEAYQKSKDLLAQLWQHQQITDTPAQTYLENKDLQWQTIINKPVTKTPTAENVSLQQYFGSGTAANNFLKRIYLWATTFSSLCFVAALLGLIGLLILNFSNSRRFSAFTYKQAFTDSVKFNYIDTSGSKLADEVILNIDSIQASLNNYQPAVLLLNINDSLKNIAVRVNGNILFDTIMSVNNNGYNITLEKNKIPPGTVWPNFTNGIWVMSNVIDSSGGNWNNSTIKFTSQKNTSGKLILSGIFIWRRNSILLGKEQFSGSYTADSRIIKLNGSSFSSLTKAGKAVDFVLGSFSAILSADEQNLSEGTWGSVSSAAEIMPLRNNSKWNARRDSSGKSAAITNDQVPPVSSPLINIRISDNSLASSAAAFAAELKRNGYSIQKIEKWDYNENSSIYYYSAAVADKASAIKKIYNKYYPELNVLTRLVQRDNSISNNNFITIWIKKYEAPQPRFEIKNIQFKQTVKPKELLDVSFDIVNNGTLDRTKLYGRICILSEPSCSDFSFSQVASINIKQSINIDNKTVGKHEIRVVVASIKIDQSLGFFTIETPAAIQSPAANNEPVEKSENKRILWIDDNALNNASLADYFKKANYTVDIVTDNQTALDFIKKNNYEIIITDITRNNKKESGIDLLKNLSFNKDKVIIYTSPLSEKKYAKEIMAMGYYKIFTKANDLINAVDKRQYRQSSN